MSVDIVIPTFNTRQLTEKCITSIMKYEPKANIYIIDNDSNDDSESRLPRYPIQYLRQNKNFGYGKACNIGIRKGKGEYILILNSDTELISPCLEKMIQVFKSDKNIGIVGPKLINSTNRIVGCGVVGTNAKPKIRGWLEPNTTMKYNTQMECVSVCGAAMMLKRDNISKLGLFDERYFFYFEETDLCYHARELGYKVIYTPAVTIMHRHKGSCNNNKLLKKYFSESKEIFDTKFKHMMTDRRIYQ